MSAVAANALGSLFEFANNWQMMRSNSGTLWSPSPDHPVGDAAEPALHLVEPETAGRREVEVEPAGCSQRCTAALL
jgi:TRAP-type C4-dicarboxylate transport system substrate-binding protein